MSKNDIINLIKKILSGTATTEDRSRVDEHFRESFYSEEWDGGKMGNRDEVENRIVSGVRKHFRGQERKKIILIKQYMPYAAALALLIGVGIYLNTASDKSNKTSAVIHNKTLLDPGSNIASLELGNGKILDLSAIGTGEQINDAGISIRKTGDGNIEYVYTGDTQSQNDTNEYNTLETPVGGTFQIALEDGTKVWLNAGSTLTFPKKFSSNQRLVKAAGEVYFEVSHDASRPFVVSSRGLEVRVLGTKFNLSAYDNNPSVSVALVEGSVEMKAEIGKPAVLAPGKKGTFENGEIGISNFDIESEIAWKNNYFIFKDQNIKDIMNSLARWYNADISYQGTEGWNDKNFTLRMSRRENIKEILSLIELTRSVRFSIDGRKIMVIQN